MSELRTRAIHEVENAIDQARAALKQNPKDETWRDSLAVWKWVRALLDSEPDTRYVVVRSALEAAHDVLDEEVGCDCGTDEPGTCASCLVEEALRILPVGPVPRVERDG